MNTEPPKVIAIISRDEAGVWQRVASVDTQKGDKVLLLPTDRGLVMVLGEIEDEDRPTISLLLEEIDSNR